MKTQLTFVIGFFKINFEKHSRELLVMYLMYGLWRITIPSMINLYFMKTVCVSETTLWIINRSLFARSFVRHLANILVWISKSHMHPWLLVGDKSPHDSILNIQLPHVKIIQHFLQIILNHFPENMMEFCWKPIWASWFVILVPMGIYSELVNSFSTSILTPSRRD
jgi:hypothetical protein